MTTQLTEGSLEDRVVARIKDSLGDLMKDEDYKRLTERAIEQAFFTERKRDPYGYNQQYEPPKLVELVRQAVENQVATQVEAYIAAHPEEVNKAIELALGKGMLELMTSYWDMKARGPMMELAGKLVQQGLLK
jgi:hypothetical protein